MTISPRFPASRLFPGVLAVALAIASPALADAPAIADLVGQFDEENYRDLVTNRLYAERGMNRAAGTGLENALCREFIHAELLRYGLDASQDLFEYVDTEGVPRIAGNVIAIKPGLRNPANEIYVVGSHFDSEQNPGADDNATGVAALLEMARIFSKHQFARTIVFCAFDAEEIYDFFGARRLGSTRFVSQHSSSNIRGMISVDMIGWQASGTSANQAWIYGRPGVADTIRNDLSDAIRLYGDGLEPVIRPGSGDYSDHVAFADAGIQSCLLIEGSFSSNPNYHERTDYSDKPNYLDWNYAGRMARSAIGYFAVKLEPLDTLPRLALTRAGSGEPAILHLAGLPGCTYSLERSSMLEDWSVFATEETSTEDGTLMVVDNFAINQTTGFYRARFVSANVASRLSTNPP